MTSMTDVYALETLRQQTWCYELRLQHFTLEQIAARSARPVSDGGLGVALTNRAIRKLIDGYLDRERDTLRVNRNELIARELNDLDLVQRLALAAMEVAAKAGKLDRDAAKVMLEASDRRRRLLGLDAPVEARLDVTVVDAATAELNAMLAEAGIDWIAQP